MHDLVAGARRFVDIAAAAARARHALPGALRAGLNELAASGRPVTVRFIVGQYPPDEVDAAALLASLTSELRDIPGAPLTIDVAAMQLVLCLRDSARASPGRTPSSSPSTEAWLVVGGHNLWSEDYLDR